MFKNYFLGYAGAYSIFKWNDDQCSSTTDPNLFFRLFQLDIKHGADANLIFNVVCQSCAHYIIKVYNLHFFITFKTIGFENMVSFYGFQYIS